LPVRADHLHDIDMPVARVRRVEIDVVAPAADAFASLRDLIHHVGGEHLAEGCPVPRIAGGPVAVDDPRGFAVLHALTMLAGCDKN
jgi:hypothetical protein